MKFTLNWLKEFLNTSASLSEIITALNSIGLEVSEVIDRNVDLKTFEVALITKTMPHPSAEKLKVCEVETSNGNLQIVCGAKNARNGLKVVLAPIGSVIPNGNFKIKESAIRSVKSYGMLCSAEELNINLNFSEGIIELPSDAQIGEQILQYFGLGDPVISIDITPNRADALGVYGIARDLAAKGLGELKQLKIDNVKNNFKSNISLNIKEPDHCSVFAIRELKNLSNKSSPSWLKERLKSIGVTPISAIIDVTNYISYSFGQPMHAYNKETIIKGLDIRLAAAGTQFQALNNKDYMLSEQDLVVADAEHIQSLAGIIGSSYSACSKHNDELVNIILEAACFSAEIIMDTGRRHNILTDSRYRFERNVDGAFTLNALDIATNLIVSICGGEASERVVKTTQQLAEKVIALPLEFITTYTGIEISEINVVDILTKLGFTCALSDLRILSVVVPSWRSDITIKEHLVEEILRIYGYDLLPSIAFAKDVDVMLPKTQRYICEMRRIIANQGYDETVNWSFIDQNLATMFTKIKDELIIINPISIDLNYMRPSIVPSLLKAAAKNIARSIKDLALFEIGPVFNGTKIEDEQIQISGIRCGFDGSKNCHSSIRSIDVFDIKADLSILLNSFGLNIDDCTLTTAPNYYHKTRSAHLLLGKRSIATFGQLHPLVLKSFGIDQDIYAFELNLSNIPQKKGKFGRRDEFIFSDFPSVSRDFAFVVDQQQIVGEIIKYISHIDKKLIKSVDLFDIYKSDNMESNTKSIALAVLIQANDRTLNEQEIEILSQSIISGVEKQFGAKLRT
ncbi:MAG: phenylalanine--tRNA ligase subunit beta [Rickettsiaceae bacterium]|nr:MAG: phenylalanine--tRNA ligase subunit beta [Rickettsiaceae bacterium]